MKIKVGDKVKILAGKDRGKEGRVTVTLKKKDKVVVEGVNIVKKHMKPGKTNESGGILETENPIHVSNVKLVEAVKADAKEKKAKAKEAKTAEPKAVKKAEVKTAKQPKATKTEKTIAKVAPKATRSNRTKVVGGK